MVQQQTPAPMQGKVCLITGANSGIGKATALGLARLGATVVMVCRDRARGEEAQLAIARQSGHDAVDLMLADLSSQQSIRQLAATFQQRYRHLHVLINNAGSVFSPRQESVDGLEMTFAVNYLAPFLLTNLLLDVLKSSAPARIFQVSSSVERRARFELHDLQFHHRYSFLRAMANRNWRCCSSPTNWRASCKEQGSPSTPWIPVSPQPTWVEGVSRRFLVC